MQDMYDKLQVHLVLQYLIQKDQHLRKQWLVKQWSNNGQTNGFSKERAGSRTISWTINNCFKNPSELQG